MNDLKQFLLELNQTNLSRKLDKRHHIVLQISSIFLIEREILFHVSTAVDFIDHSKQLVLLNSSLSHFLSSLGGILMLHDLVTVMVPLLLQDAQSGDEYPVPMLKVTENI